MKRTRIIGIVSGLALALMAGAGGASRTKSQQARRHPRNLQPRKSTMLSFSRYPNRSLATSRSLQDRCSRTSRWISSKKFQPRDSF
jgi:hypothetical protein